MRCIIDIETEGIDNPQVIHCIVTKDIDTGEVNVFKDKEVLRKELPKFLRLCTDLVGHNIIAFDLPVICCLLDVTYTGNIVDTLVIARVLNYNQPGGNSLEAWGRRLGLRKGDFKDFSKLSDEMIEYCIQDVEVTHRLYQKFLPYLESPDQGEVIRLEHQIAQLCNELHDNGFCYDISRSRTLRLELQEKIKNLREGMDSVFPPRARSIRYISPRLTQKHTLSIAPFAWLVKENRQNGITTPPDLSPYSADAPFTLIEWVPFNPGSPKQCVDRLWEFGWEPVEKTKGHLKAERDRDTTKLDYYSRYGWRVSDFNLATLPEGAPEASRSLVQWLLYNSREKSLETWETAYRPSTGRIYGRFNHIGAWTHRMSHAEPNMANIPSNIGRDGKVAEYGKEFRELWKASPGHVLVGCDADGIQLRVLAHYMDDSRFTEALISGRKEDGTDAHSLNQRALGAVCRSREVAKTFIYSWLLGAGEGKTAGVLGCSIPESKAARGSFIDFYPGLKRIKKEVIPEDARRGYFTGFDGRRVLCSSEHFMLAGYLQAGEAVVMKHASLIWKKELSDLGIPYRFVDFVHDEWQTESRPEFAEKIGEVQAESIRRAGENLGLLCPMKGNFKVGKDWYETH